MTKAIKKVLIVYKRSAYEIYFLTRESTMFGKQKAILQKELARFTATHKNHYATLQVIKETLRKYKVDYKIVGRGERIAHADFDLIITVGGDGTFLEVARRVTRQLILGVNSDPLRSVGRFCCANKDNFASIFPGVFRKKAKVTILSRLLVRKTGFKKIYHALNDVLIAHKNPAAMSRYYLTVGGVTEEQRSSGLWVATAAGSTGAVHSAGGKVLPPTRSEFQYKPRELYRGINQRYNLSGGIVAVPKHVKVESLMRNGTVFIDGAHLQIPLSYGETLTVSHSPEPLRIVWGNRS